MMDQPAAAIGRRNGSDGSRPLAQRAPWRLHPRRARGAGARHGRDCPPLPLAIDVAADAEGIIQAGFDMTQRTSSLCCGGSTTGLSAIDACACIADDPYNIRSTGPNSEVYSDGRGW